MKKNIINLKIILFILLLIQILFSSSTISNTIDDENGIIISIEDLSNTDENIKPVANISSGKFYEYPKGSKITFNASGSYDPNNNITGYRWDFNGNGSYDTNWLTNPTSSHTFNNPGIYTVVLQVKNENNDTDLDSAIVDISHKPLVVEIKCVKTGLTSQYISFYADIVQNLSIVNYTWIFGDDNVGYEINTTHKFNSPGDYYIQLIIEDDKQSTYHDMAALKIKLDTDKDLLSDEIEEIIGSPIWTKNNYQNIQINFKLHILVDIDNDVKYDVFYNQTSKKTSNLIHNGSNILIDDDIDGKYDYKFNVNNGLIERYISEKDNNIEDKNDTNGKDEDSTPGLSITLVLFTIFITFMFINRKKGEQN